MAQVRVTLDVAAAAAKATVDRAVEAFEPPVVTEAVLAAARTYRDGARRRAPRRSGRLAASIEAHVTGSHTAQASTDLVYALIQEVGGTIRPRQAELLAFDAGGGVRFAGSVRIEAQPYWVPTFDADTDVVAEAAFDVIVEHVGM